MEKLTKSLSLFKERNCSVSIVLDSRTRRKNACEFPLSLRFTIDRKFFYFLKSATPFPKCYLHKEEWTFDS
ncbi:hypothetical protein [Phocaeicola vulgatus]|uniref:hypothetical protein n=1 Tax=Phocaeicola vulgatus TaxID=821 RepID=UPI00189B1893|nr:hypothetical protein [Phocaeicola vulgatus]